MKDINNRIKLLREELGLSQEKFGKKIGLSKSGISNIEKGTRNVTEKHIKLICLEFNVNDEWLYSGKGNIFNSIPKNLIDELVIQYKLSDSDKKILENFLSLSENERTELINYCTKIFNVGEKQSSEEKQRLSCSTNSKNFDKKNNIKKIG